MSEERIHKGSFLTAAPFCLGCFLAKLDAGLSFFMSC